MKLLVKQAVDHKGRRQIPLDPDFKASTFFFCLQEVWIFCNSIQFCNTPYFQQVESFVRQRGGTLSTPDTWPGVIRACCISGVGGGLITPSSRGIEAQFRQNVSCLRGWLSSLTTEGVLSHLCEFCDNDLNQRKGTCAVKYHSSSHVRQTHLTGINNFLIKLE